MKSPEEDGLPDTPASPEAGVAGAPPQPPADGAEPTGLIGVDAEPQKPLTREEVEAVRRERDDLRDQLLRKRADFDNYRKRVDRDRQQAGVDAAAAIFRALIPTLDNLERALKAGAKEEPLREGVELILRDLTALLEGQGVVVHDPAGQRFDPQTHQALTHEAAPGFAEGTVVEVFQKGYFFKDRLLRPALVKVAKGETQERERGPEAVH